MLFHAAIIVSFVLIFKSFSVFRKGRIRKRLMQRGPEANAVILNIQLTGQYKNRHPQVNIQLQVEPEQKKNFVTDITQVLRYTDFSLLQPGTRLRVRYNPHNHKEVFVQDIPVRETEKAIPSYR